MTIEEILLIEDNTELIKALKSQRGKDLPDIELYKKQWSPSTHEVMTNKSLLPDKTVKRGDAEVLKPVNRITAPLQKKIVNTAVSFAFGNPVSLNAEPENTNQQLLFDALSKIDKDNKLKSFNRKVYREVLRATEVAELWYLKEVQKDEYYGFSTNERLRVAAFNPFDGDILYPCFDEYNDLVAFSREYIVKDEKGKEITCFDSYLDDRTIKFKKLSGNWELISEEVNTLGKIPVVYMSAESPDWSDVQTNIERIEFLCSKLAETNDYHSSPTVFVEGNLTSMPEKGESGKVIQGKNGTKAYYLSWDNMPQSLKLELEMLVKFTYGLTGTPDVSFDSVKGLGSISGVALEMLFMDAHLKVQEKKEYLDEYLQRRVNIQLHILGQLSNLQNDAALLNVEPEIIPFKINDEKTTIENIATAVGSGILSKRSGIKVLSWVKDTDDELAQINKEEAQSQSHNLFEPTAP